MRLWHKDLVDVLPRQWLLGQWRELNSIFKNQNRHILINFVYEYPNTLSDLYSYSLLIIEEMDKREYRHNDTNFNNFFFTTLQLMKFSKITNFYPEKMTQRYLKQCLYNLQEKYDCGAMTEEEWGKIYGKFKAYLEEM